MSTIVLEEIEEPEGPEELQPPEIAPEPHEAEILEHEFVPVTNEIVPTPPAPAPKSEGDHPKQRPKLRHQLPK